MANVINQLLTANRHANVPLPNPNQAMLLGQKGIGSGIDQLMQVGKQIKQNRINSDVASVLGMIDNNIDNPSMYQDQLFKGISQIEGIDPMTAIGLATTLSKPRLDERKYTNDRIDAENLNSYRSTMASKGSFGMTTDDYGNAWLINKNTGEVTPYATGNEGRVNPKNIVLKPVTSRDTSGIEKTEYVPFDKTTGLTVQQTTVGQDDNAVIAEHLRTEYGINTTDGFYALSKDQQNIIRADIKNILTPADTDNTISGVGMKYPAVAQKDKEYADNIPVIEQNLENLEKMIMDPGFGGAFGALDQYTGQVGGMFPSPTDDSKKQAEVKALTSNMLAGFGKAQMAGVLTDQDMNIIRQQIPDVSDQPDIAMKKINFIKSYMEAKNKAFRERMGKSNPGYVSENMHNDLNRTIEQNKGGSPYGSGTEIISF